jgi:hypothetical protein
MMQMVATAGTGVISTTISTMVQGALQVMLFAKIKTIGADLSLVALVGGSGFIGWGLLPADSGGTRSKGTLVAEKETTAPKAKVGSVDVEFLKKKVELAKEELEDASADFKEAQADLKKHGTSETRAQLKSCLATMRVKQKELLDLEYQLAKAKESDGGVAPKATGEERLAALEKTVGDWKKSTTPHEAEPEVKLPPNTRLVFIRASNSSRYLVPGAKVDVLVLGEKGFHVLLKDAVVVAIDRSSGQIGVAVSLETAKILLMFTVSQQSVYLAVHVPKDAP